MGALRLNSYAPDLVVSYLRTKYPEVNKKITEELATILPKQTLTDFSLIPQLLHVYCQIRQINPEQLHVYGYKVDLKLVQYRKEFLALLLICFQPEKLYGLIQKPALKGITLQVSQLLGCNRTTLKNYVGEIIVRFRHYEAFKTDLLALHAQILATIN
ncbi:hypothetical protein AHMF7605_11670 [Adhaeribacter arboris]|uniref:Uncharacterized protein n=1 Tax=Adhaeribacter arboris TaxID=2072846 RepID=A0A2T2YF44_9BACT|nr:hypothetical protein [Adhaeribacter arboris]PSR54130.1 hypothetical protein AHMF7605_11670 [Adhaeribacter arboris]